MILLENISIGEVYLDGDLIFQHLEVLNDGQLEHELHIEYNITKEPADIHSNFIG